MKRLGGESVRERFHAHFGGEPDVVVRAPGRVNLIGEHTDYNDGFVLPIAIDRDTWIALRARSDRRVRAIALDLAPGGTEASFDLDAIERGSGWQEYLKGVAWALHESSLPTVGWEGIVTSDVPRGAGLSSSASLELAALRAFHELAGFRWDREHMARLARRVENAWVGVSSGIMDPFISAHGLRDHALLLDARSLTWEKVPMPAGFSVVVLDTGTRRGLIDSDYNARRAECEAAAAALGVASLRDVTSAEFAERSQGMDDVLLRRARHVVSENDRTLRAAEALRTADIAMLGSMLDASHESLQHDFEVSSPALDAIVASVRDQEGCVGARMTGAGFGGCAVALIRDEFVDGVIPAVEDGYRAATGHHATVYVCKASSGAVRVRPVARTHAPAPPDQA